MKVKIYTTKGKVISTFLDENLEGRIHDLLMELLRDKGITLSEGEAIARVWLD